jgi:hypothetical protein
MSYMDSSHITRMSYMQRDDMHSLLSLDSRSFNELQTVRVAYTTSSSRMPVVIRHI